MIKNTDRIFVAITGLIAAACMMYLAAPRLIVAFKAFGGDAIVAEINAGGRPDVESVRELVANRAALLAVNGNPQYARDLSRAYHALSLNPERAEQVPVVAAGRDASIVELTLLPLNGAAWWRLSLMEYVQNGFPTRKTANYLMRSLRDQPNALVFTWVRLGDIIEHWGYFNLAERRMIGAHVAGMWRRYPLRENVLKAASQPFYRGVLRAALMEDNPDVLKQFDLALINFDKRRSREKK